MLQIYEKIAEKIAHKRVFLTFLSLILIQTFALAQNDSKITIQQKNITVIDALKTVEKQSKKSINYSDSELKGKVIAKFQQSIILPDNVEKDKITAKVEHGILSIDIPKTVDKEVQKITRTIDIK